MKEFSNLIQRDMCKIDFTSAMLDIEHGGMIEK